MKKKGLLITAALVVVLALTGCKGGSDAPKETEGGDKQSKGELNIMTWIDYVPGEVMEAFEAETGIKVNPTYISSNEEMLTKLRMQKDTYDVIVCSDATIELMIKEGGLIQKLDKEQIPNFENIAPAFQSQYFDPANEYSVPHAAYCALLVYNMASPVAVKGYADMWNPALRGAVVLLDDMRGTIGLTSQISGGDVNETDPEKLQGIKERMFMLRPNVIAFDADHPHELLLSGDAMAGYMFGSQIMAAIEVGAEKNPPMEFAYAYPEEGMSYGMDCYVVAEGAPNKDNAMAFLNYVLEGEVSAKISTMINYINCNQAATAFLSEEFLANPVVNIPIEEIQKAQMYRDIDGATMQLYDEIWTEFKNR